MRFKFVALALSLLLLFVSAALADGETTSVRVSYLGPAGTYTEEAAQFFFPDGASVNPKEAVNDAIADVLEGAADYAVIPQENTLGGAVVNYVDALIAAKDAYVVGEVVLPHQPDAHGCARRGARGHSNHLLARAGTDPERGLARGKPAGGRAC